jgi:hypothetical protein
MSKTEPIHVIWQRSAAAKTYRKSLFPFPWRGGGGKMLFSASEHAQMIFVFFVPFEKCVYTEKRKPTNAAKANKGNAARE